MKNKIKECNYKEINNSNENKELKDESNVEKAFEGANTKEFEVIEKMIII